MAYNMAWFKAQEEKKKAEELAKKKAENPNYVEDEVVQTSSKKGTRLF